MVLKNSDRKKKMQLISVFSLSFLEFRKMKKKVEDRDFKVTQRENILPIIILKKILSLFLIFKSSSHLPKKNVLFILMESL